MGNYKLTTASDIVPSAGQAIPGNATIRLVGEDRKRGYIDVRRGSVHGTIEPLAASLSAGDASWSIDLVSGADLSAAQPSSIAIASQLAAAGYGGNLARNDPHYTDPNAFFKSCRFVSCNLDTPIFSVVRIGTGGLLLSAGGAIDQVSASGIYTGGTQSAPETNAADNNVPEPRALDRVGIGPASLKAVAAAQLEVGYKPYCPTNRGDVSILAGGSIATYQDPAGSDWQFAKGGPEWTPNNLTAGTAL